MSPHLIPTSWVARYIFSISRRKRAPHFSKKRRKKGSSLPLSVTLYICYNCTGSEQVLVECETRRSRRFAEEAFFAIKKASFPPRKIHRHLRLKNHRCRHWCFAQLAADKSLNVKLLLLGSVNPSCEKTGVELEFEGIVSHS